MDLRAGAVRDLVRRDESTLKALAASCGWSRDYLHKLLSGTRPCTWSNLLVLSRALDVEPTTIADVRPMGKAA